MIMVSQPQTVTDVILTRWQRPPEGGNTWRSVRTMPRRSCRGRSAPEAGEKPSRAPGGSSSRPPWRISTHTPQLVSTSATTSAHLCGSLPEGRTTSAPPRSTSPTPGVISSPRRSRCTRSSLSARISRWARRAGSRWPTTPSTGPTRTLLCAGSPRPPNRPHLGHTPSAAPYSPEPATSCSWAPMPTAFVCPVER